MNIESIQSTKAGFEESFREKTMYNRQTQDKEHLDGVIESLQIKDGMRVLDLGTGSGYVAFEIARRFPNVTVYGLDIVEEALQENRSRAAKENLQNIQFISYEGMNFPLNNNTFDVVVTRYALHHFPDINFSFAEVSRVLKDDGMFFISDPTPNENDTERFVDDYMKMKKDGHIKYYTREEFTRLLEKNSFHLENSFMSEITFPRWKETAYGYEEILKKHDKKVIESYKVFETEDGKYIYITQNVLNMTFRKNGQIIHT